MTRPDARGPADPADPPHPADPADPTDPIAPVDSDGPQPADPNPLRERPLGLSLLLWFLGFWAGAAALAFLGVAIGDGPVMLSGRAVPRPEARMAVLPVLLPMGLAAAGGALALGLGKRWARPAILLPFLLAGLTPLWSGAQLSLLDLAAAVLVGVPVLAGVGWYLYRSAEATAWFQRPGPDAPPAGSGSGRPPDVSG